MSNARRLALPALMIALGLSLAGCSSIGSSGSAIAGKPVTGPQSNVVEGASGSDQSSGTVVKRQVVTTGTVVIRAQHPIAAADRAASITDAAGGRVDDRDQSAATSSSSERATLTLRIPSSRLTPTLEKLKAIGSELSVSISTNDVTTASEDLSARIYALQTSITRLLALETNATNTADVITLENDIATRQGQLESLTAQRRYLDDQVSMATITLRLVAPSAAVVTPGPPSAGAAILAGLSGFGVFFTWLFLGILYALPWLVLAAAVWVGLVFLLRWRRRRRAVTPAE